MDLTRGGDSFIKDGNARPIKRAKRAGEGDGRSSAPQRGLSKKVRSKTLVPILPEPTAEELSTEKLELLSKCELVNKLRRDAVLETVQGLRVLYDTRREAFAQIEKMDAILGAEDDNACDLARIRRTAEEASLKSINEQISNLEANVVFATRRRPL